MTNSSEIEEKIWRRRLVPALECRVRELQEDDCARLEWHGGEDLRAWYQAQWRNHCEERVCVLIADWNDFPVGQVAVHWHGKPTHPHVPDIQSLRVFGAFRGLGIGSLLLEGAEKLVRERGFAQVSLAVALDNPRARQLYQRRGYHILGDAYDDVWEFTDVRGDVCRMSERVLDMMKNL